MWGKKVIPGKILLFNTKWLMDNVDRTKKVLFQIFCCLHKQTLHSRANVRQSICQPISNKTKKLKGSLSFCYKCIIVFMKLSETLY